MGDLLNDRMLHVLQCKLFEISSPLLHTGLFLLFNQGRYFVIIHLLDRVKGPRNTTSSRSG